MPLGSTLLTMRRSWLDSTLVSCKTYAHVTCTTQLSASFLYRSYLRRFSHIRVPDIPSARNALVDLSRLGQRSRRDCISW